MALYLIIILAVITRFLPHEANVGLVTALAIFAGATLTKRQAIAIPVAVRFVSDIFLGFFSPVLMVSVYVSHLAGALFGFWIKNTDKTGNRWMKIIASALGSSAIFFLVTNFAFFYSVDEYAHNWSGIILSYTNGLPFLRGTLIGDVGYTVLLFGVYELARYYTAVKTNVFGFTHRAIERFKI